MWINKVRIREGRDTKRQGYEKTRREEKRNGGMLESIVIHRHCYMEKAKPGVHKIKLSLFCDFFPLWGYFLPYIYKEMMYFQNRAKCLLSSAKHRDFV